jgi:hypothetical protein
MGQKTVVEKPKFSQAQEVLIKTPQDLVDAIKKKNSALAEKISRKFRIPNDTQKQWEDLKKELTEQEKTEIKNTLTNPENKKMIDGKLSSLSKKVTARLEGTTIWKWKNLAVMWAVWITGKAIIEGKAGWVDLFLDKIADWFNKKFDSIGDWFNTKISSFLKFFWFDIEEKKEKISETITEGNEKLENEKYRLASEWLVKSFGYQFKGQKSLLNLGKWSRKKEKQVFMWQMETLFGDDKFANKPISEIKNLHNLYYKKEKQGLAKKLGFDNISDDVVWYGMSLLVSENSLWYKTINQIYKKNGKSIDTLTVKKVILGIYDEISLTKNLSELVAILPELIQHPSKIKDLFSEGIAVENDEKGVSKIKWWLTNESILKKLGITWEIVKFMKTTNDFEGTLKDINTQSTYNLSEEDKKNLTEKILPFSQSIRQTILSPDFNFLQKSKGSNLKNILESKDKKLTSNEILDLYITTWGETDFKQLSSIRQAVFIMRTLWISIEKDPGSVWVIIWDFVDNARLLSTNIPKDTQDVILTLWGNTLKEATTEVIEWLGLTIEIYRRSFESHPFWTLFVTALLLGLPLFSSKKVNFIERFFPGK